MRPGLLWLASFVTFPVVGAPLLGLSCLRNLSWSARVVLAAAIGIVVSAWTMTLFSCAGLAWRLPVILVFGTSVSAALRWLVVSDPDTVTFASSPKGSLDRIAFWISIFAVGIAAIAAASSAATSSDLVLFWGPKAEAFAEARGLDSGYLGNPFLLYQHRSYPPLLPSVYALATLAAGRFSWGGAILTFPILLGALALSLPNVLKLSVPPSAAWATSSFLIASTGFLGHRFELAGNGEIPLIFFESLALALLMGPLRVRAEGQLLAGVLLAGAAMTKAEGLPLVLTTVSLFLLTAPQVRSVAAAARLLLPTLLGVGTWFAFGATRHVFLAYQEFGGLPVVWSHLPVVAREAGRGLWSSGYAIPYLVPLVALFVGPRPSSRLVLPLGVVLTMGAFYLFTFLHGAEDPALWLRWSVGRVFVPLAAILALSAAMPRETAKSLRADVSPEPWEDPPG